MSQVYDEWTIGRILMLIKRYGIDLWSHKYIIILLVLSTMLISFIRLPKDSDYKYNIKFEYQHYHNVKIGEKFMANGRVRIVRQHSYKHINKSLGAKAANKISVYYTSPSFVQNLMVRKITHGMVEDYFANHLINRGPEYEQFNLLSSIDQELSESDKAMVRTLSKTLLNSPISSIKLSTTEAVNIFDLVVTTKKPELSKFIAQTFYTLAKKEFNSEKKQVEHNPSDFIKEKVNIAESKIERLNTSLATIKDKSRNLISNYDRLRQKRVERQLSFSEQELNMYNARLGFLDSKKYLSQTKFKILNESIYPLEIKAQWKLKFFLIGALSLLISIFLVFVKKAIFDLLERLELFA